MVSVERMFGYGKLESERELEMDIQDNGRLLGWPEKGVIELCNVKFKYAMEYPYVLKSISFKIESCEKVSDVTYQTNKILSYLNRLALWVGLELASLPCCQHCSD